jgi:pilus assembly protein Flp/PilA
MPARIRRLACRARDRGASAVEYGLLVAAIAAAIVGIVFGLGSIVQGAFRHTCDTIAASPAGGGGDCGAPVDAPAPPAP